MCSPGPGIAIASMDRDWRNKSAPRTLQLPAGGRAGRLRHHPHSQRTSRFLEQQHVAIRATGKADLQWIEQRKLRGRKRTRAFAHERFREAPLFRFPSIPNLESQLARQFTALLPKCVRIDWIGRAVGDQEAGIAAMRLEILRKAAESP